MPGSATAGQHWGAADAKLRSSLDSLLEEDGFELAVPPRTEGRRENWAMLASLLETCKLHDVSPEAYLSECAHQARQRRAQ